MGQGLFILLLAPAFFEPLRELSSAWHDRASGIAAMNNIATLSQAASMIVGSTADVQTTAPTQTTRTAQTTSPAAIAIDIKDLSFTPAEQAPVLAHLNLSIAAGEHIALTGASGSGKSILLALIAGLIAPTRGDITLNGVAMNPANASQLRQQIAWMGQQPHIFTGSIHTNVFLGRDVADTTAITYSLQTTGMDQVIKALPVHVLGEGGLGLSGGEVARLALVRLAAQTEAGLIILDEPTAHLDFETAQQVIDAIQRIARNKTLIIATHDPVLLSSMDRQITVTTTQGEMASV
jgi:ATP-binding cassette subfamily C protein CydD